MNIAWVGSPNFSPGRDGHNPSWTAADPNTWIVLHTSVSTLADLLAGFASPARQASSHYAVDLDGTIYQFVKETDAAWTNGTYADNPGSNLDSITIEHVDNKDYNGPRTPELYEASAQLVADISRRRGIPLVHRRANGGVIGHRECGPNGIATGCPDGLDVDRIIARAIEINNPPKPPVEPPEDEPQVVPVPPDYHIFSFEVVPPDPSAFAPMAGAMQFADAIANAKLYLADHPGSTVKVITEVS
jgi:N-acetylmuramoyl-L-alanine amidase